MTNRWLQVDQNFRVIGQETNRLDPFIFKTGGKMYYPIVHVTSY